jgi:hypothetical protein
MRRHLSHLIFVCILIAAPTAMGADNAPPTPAQLHAAYCAGYHQQREAEIGDTCIEARVGWTNTCSADVAAERQFLAELTAQRAIDKAGVGEAIQAGQAGFHQCVKEAASDAGLAQMAECRKHYTGQQLTACIESGPAEPTCEKLRICGD